MLVRKKYRVVTDKFSGYEVQHKYEFWPFWFQSNNINTHKTLDDAKIFIEDLKKEGSVKCKVVYIEED